MRRTDKASITGDEQRGVSGFEIGEKKVEFAGGEIRMLVDEKIVGKCTMVEFSNKPNAMFRVLMGYREKMRT